MFKETFKITNNSIILAVPMIICLKIVELYTKFTSLSADSNAKFLLATITLILMIGVFCAGFFYMIKKAIEINKNIYIIEADKTKELLSLIYKAPEGIAKYFLSFTGTYITFITIQILLLPFIILLGLKLFGNMSDELMKSVQTLIYDSSPASIDNFVNGLSDNNLLYLVEWVLLFICIMFVVLYLFLLWIPEIIYKTTNPLKALFYSIGKTFKKFPKTFGIYLLINVCILIVSFATTYLTNHPLGIIIFEVIKYYLYLYFIFLIFIYYDKHYNDNEKNEISE